MNKKRLNKEIKFLDMDLISKSGYKFKYFNNSDDIINFLKTNQKVIKETSFYNSGGGMMIYYILIDNKIYSISDEILDNKNNDCIIYYGFNSIDEFIDYDGEWDRDKGCYNDYNDLKQKFIKI